MENEDLKNEKNTNKSFNLLDSGYLSRKGEEQNLIQEQLAEKCGTTKSYISRIENNASDIINSYCKLTILSDLSCIAKLKTNNQ